MGTNRITWCEYRVIVGTVTAIKIVAYARKYVISVFFLLNHIKSKFFFFLVLLHTDNHLAGNKHCPGQLQSNCICKTVPSVGTFSWNKLRPENPNYFAKDGVAAVFNRRKVKGIGMGGDWRINKGNCFANALHTALCPEAIFNNLLRKNQKNLIFF